MAQIRKKLTRPRGDMLHHDNGAHRLSPRSADARHVDGYDAGINDHLDEHEVRADECGTAFAHTPDRDIDPGPDCAICGEPRE